MNLLTRQPAAIWAEKFVLFAITGGERPIPAEAAFLTFSVDFDASFSVRSGPVRYVLMEANDGKLLLEDWFGSPLTAKVARRFRVSKKRRGL